MDGMQDKSTARGLRWLGPLAGPLDRYLSGGKSSDPLCQSNQSVWQKTRGVVLIALPLALVASVAVLSSLRLIKKTTVPAKEPTAAEVAVRSLPNFNNIKIAGNTDVTVLEAEIKTVGGARVIAGRVRNNTDHRLAVVEVVFETTTFSGSQLGAEVMTLEDIGPRSLRTFGHKTRTPEAVFALVGEVRTR